MGMHYGDNPVFKPETQHHGTVTLCGTGKFLLVSPDRGVFGIGC